MINALLLFSCTTHVAIKIIIRHDESRVRNKIFHIISILHLISYPICNHVNYVYLWCKTRPRILYKNYKANQEPINSDQWPISIWKKISRNNNFLSSMKNLQLGNVKYGVTVCVHWCNFKAPKRKNKMNAKIV